VKEIKQALMVFILMTILTGFLYPMAVTGIAQEVFPYQANGSLIKQKNKVVGSQLIGQSFTSPKYFNSRPSSISYNAASSGASNLGPTSKQLMEEVKKRIQKIRAANGLSPNQPVPADLVLGSASGLDPDITVQSALLQVPRIAKINCISPATLKALIQKNTIHSFLGWGMTRVNVLKLNLELNKVQSHCSHG
jgi:K+-transporting ATPase ATPase C chain